jgi:hypothetical protein
MNKKLFLLVILVIALVFGMTVVGCGEDPAEYDTWSKITSLDQMNGTWKGTYSINNKPFKDIIEEQGGTWDPSMQLVYGNMTVSSKSDITVTINARAKTQAMSVASTMIFSGGTINVLWPMAIKPLFENMEEDGITITTNDAKHSVTITAISPPEPLSDEEITELLNSDLQINQNSTKIKAPENSFGEGMPELIFYKQL